jgi:hypothetical protein
LASQWRLVSKLALLSVSQSALVFALELESRSALPLELVWLLASQWRLVLASGSE